MVINVFPEHLFLEGCKTDLSITAFKDIIVTALANWGALDQLCLEMRHPGAGFRALSHSESLTYFVLVIMGICSSKVIS